MLEKKVRANVIISGKVQGVFFRAETLKAASKNNVSGWVRNKKDGTVEAVFEGKEKDVLSILEWCKTGSPHSMVKNTDVRWDDYQGEFSSFEITR
ncbi:Acylphosphatase [Desulfonema limicola]|uniref:Acylphosphatase n=1 Tax=Desulfonema limicola TaxID=45656 RepID=A0A975BE35_9BACT|nr:acylphosphatase [Desulfonema limicola]QTA83410.1 Acylphosphatase [Desulfonema limicola]